MEEVNRGRGLSAANGADHGLGRVVDQIGNALQVDGNGAALQDATRERPEEAKCPSQTKQEGAGGRGTSSEKGARSSDMPSEKPSGSVRSTSTGSGEVC